jgi:hypothetical protein
MVAQGTAHDQAIAKTNSSPYILQPAVVSVITAAAADQMPYAQAVQTLDVDAKSSSQENFDDLFA